jgi:hypothetical protein
MRQVKFMVFTAVENQQYHRRSGHPQRTIKKELAVSLSPLASSQELLR